jgi:glycosyltransferase involved in cell wall biosynthesis
MFTVIASRGFVSFAYATQALLIGRLFRHAVRTSVGPAAGTRYIDVTDARARSDDAVVLPSRRTVEDHMKIGVIAPIAHRLPPVNYGSWEQIAATLTDGFVARGHEVTLFATANSHTTASLHATAPTGYAEPHTGSPLTDAKVWGALHSAAVFEQAADFDILANHFDFMPLTYSRLVATPMVTTIHGFSAADMPAFRAYDDIAHYVSISDADRHPDLHYDATIHHGIDLNRFNFVAEPGDYLLFLGRIHPDKGTHLAIEVAKRAHRPLIIAGVVQDEAYFDEAIRPHVDGVDVTYLGPVEPTERDALLGDARALLHLISFAEPFGLSVIESLAAGTPVIATPLGSMPELLQHGTTGFLVPDVEAAVVAVGRIEELDRQTCRQYALTRFSADRMIDAYLALFQRVLHAKPPRSTRSNQSIGSPGLFSHATL